MKKETKPRKTTLQDYHDFLEEVLKDMLAGKDPSLKITAKMRKLQDKIDFLNARKEFIDKAMLRVIDNSVVI